MQIIPEFTLKWTSGIYLGLLVIVIRYCLMYFVSRKANEQADFFPPMIGKEKIAYWVYTTTSFLIYLYLIFITIKTDTFLFPLGIFFYLLGLIILAKSTVDYAHGYQDGFVNIGIYLYSRNPMYVSYFLIYVGIGLICTSWLYLLIVLMREVSTYWLILSEERWCKEKFGEPYQKYFSNVNRYIGRSK